MVAAAGLPIRRGGRYGGAMRYPLSAAAALLLALSTTAIAQQAEDGELVLATPESLGVTPEQFAKMGFAKGAMIRRETSKSRRSFGYIEFGEAVEQPQTPTATRDVAPGAVLAQQQVRIEQRRWRVAAPIAIGAPFNTTLEAETRFLHLTDAADGSRPCARKVPYKPYTPAQDAAGNIFPVICLHGRDADGRYRTARFLPYYPARAQPRDVAIAPVELEPIAPGVVDPHFPALIAIRRLRVVKLDADGMQISVERMVKQTSAAAPLDVKGLPDTAFHTLGTHRIPLRSGAATTIDGLTLTLRQHGSVWEVESTGALAPWGQVDANRTELIFGDEVFGPVPE